MHTTGVQAVALETLISAAVAAPSIHNTQPWRFDPDPVARTIEVRLDRKRQLPLADPQRRAMYLSVGAALFNLRIAAANAGRQPVVRLLPHLGDPDLVAIVHLAGTAMYERPLYRALYEAVDRRHTSRMPFTGRPVPEPVVAGMVAAARSEGAHLDVPDILGTQRLLRLTAAAESRNRADGERVAETRGCIALPGDDTPYGIPVGALGPREATGRVPMRDFGGMVPGLRLPVLPFERHAQVALLWTGRDRREDWLLAGQALQHVLLLATVHGVRTSILHQAMEWPDLREATGAARRRCCPQLMIRFGYGPEGSPTPRASGADDDASATEGARAGSPAVPVHGSRF
jgi:hypothetical protein